MITFHDLYNVLSAVVPLYVAMILAYCAVKYWRIFTPDQCSGINRFVALFAVPLLSFHYIASNNPFTMNFRFLAADSLAKLMVLGVLFLWVRFSRNGSIDWMITLFSLSTLPNTLVMGIPLLRAMYGDFSGDLMVQIVVFQCIIWYTLLLFLFEYRGARNLITETLPEAAPSIVSFKVDPDVVSLDGRQPLATQAELRCDGKIHVTIRKSTASASSLISASARRSHAGGFAPSITPRPSNMTGAEIYSLPSSRNPTPRGSSFNHADFYSILAGVGRGGGGASNPNFISPRHSNLAPSDILGAFYGGGPGTASARTSNFDYDVDLHRFYGFNPTFSRSSVSHNDHQVIPVPGNGSRCLGNPVAENPAVRNGAAAGAVSASKQLKLSEQAKLGGVASVNEGNVGVSTNSSKDPLHMFVWSSTTASPVSDAGLGHFLGSSTRTDHQLVNHVDATGSQLVCQGRASSVDPSCKLENGHFSIQGPAGEPRDHFEEYAREDFSFGNRVMSHEEASLHLETMNGPNLAKLGSADLAGKVPPPTNPVGMPPARVMTKLILMMVWRKLIRNPNTYSSLLGVIWSLISARWGIVMPAIVSRSISILSDAGLGMAMFSLGLFMALQPKIIACGNTIAAFGMAVRFLTGPAVMAAASIAIGIRGVLLHVAIVQAALPQGIVPFVFAKEYGVHPDILSTGVIFGMLIALPITIFYYFLLGL